MNNATRRWPLRSCSCMAFLLGAWSRRTSGALLQLLQDCRVLQRGHVLRDLLALGDRAQQAAHDLARARFRQVVAEADVLRLGDRADLLADPVAQLLGDLLRFRPAR